MLTNDEESEVVISYSQEEGSILVSFPDYSKIRKSPSWNCGSWVMFILTLPPHSSYTLQVNDYVKVLAGNLQLPSKSCFCEPFTTESTIISAPVIVSGDPETCILVIQPQSQDKAIVTGTQDVLFSNGPYSNLLKWIRVSDLPWGTAFKNDEFYNLRGWKLFIGEVYICYIEAWLAGIGVNCGDHDHSEMGENTFREIHFSISNGTGKGGMVWYDNTKQQHYLPLLDGQEHGPFWTTSSDGVNCYPLHRWEAGSSENGEQEQAFDFWFAIEFPAK